MGASAVSSRKVVRDGLLALQRALALTLVCVDRTEALRQDVERVREEIDEDLGLDPFEAIPVSAKTGAGIDKILEGIVQKLPSPKGDPDATDLGPKGDPDATDRNDSDDPGQEQEAPKSPLGPVRGSAWLQLSTVPEKGTMFATLEGFGVKELVALGSVFDPEVHDAVSHRIGAVRLPVSVDHARLASRPTL